MFWKRVFFYAKIKNKSILKDCKIYIIRIKNSNEFEQITNTGKKYLNISLSNIEHGMPCSMCDNLLKKYNLKIQNIKI